MGEEAGYSEECGNNIGVSAHTSKLHDVLSSAVGLDYGEMLCILVLAGVQGECGVALRLIGGSESGVEVEGVDSARFLFLEHAQGYCTHRQGQRPLALAIHGIARSKAKPQACSGQTGWSGHGTRSDSWTGSAVGGP